MKIDATRYNLFWSNPEKYRLREIWKLAPIEPAAGTFASLMTYGRRRGTCFHELMDAYHRGVDCHVAEQELKDGGFGEKEIDTACLMADKVQFMYPDEEYLAHEATFEYQIPDSPHKMVGRIDHILKDEEGVYVGDWKTSKHRSEKDLSQKGADYCRGAQVPFYLLGASTLGFDTRRFLYRLVVDGKTGVSIRPFPTERTGLELKTFARGVHQTCDLIEYMKEYYGVQNPWPNLNGPFDGDYTAIAGQKMYDGYMPEGFQPKTEHLILMEDSK